MNNHPREKEDLCSVCGEYGSCFCRICSSRYCFDHLCLHLNVAHEDNTYTKRTSTERSEHHSLGASTDFNFGANSDEDETYVRPTSPVPEISENPIHPVQTNATPLTAYTESQLQASHQFYITQARRIKRELERRALPTAGFSFGEETPILSPRARKLRGRRPASILPEERKISRRALKTVEILTNAMRANGLTLEQIKSALGSSEPAAVK